MPEKTISSQKIFDGRAISLRVDTVLMPDGRQTTREVIEHSECVAVVPVDAEGNILLVSQFRYAIEKELLEIPAGCIEPGETPEEAVRREMREETGYLPRKIERLGGFYSSPGFSTEYLHLYLATDLTLSPLQAEDTEGIKVVKVPFRQLKRLLKSGKICDSKTVAGLHLYLEYRKGKAEKP